MYPGFRAGMRSEIVKKWERRTGQASPVQRKQPESTPAADVPATDSTGDEQQPTRYWLHCLELRPRQGLWSRPTYAELRDFMADGEKPSFVAILFHHLLVILTGRNLKSIVGGLRMRTQWTIEQNASPPADPKALYVESMEFISENIQAAFTLLQQTQKLG
jgi:hypothetical protein